MDQMQSELDAAGYEGQIEFLGVNDIGFEAGNAEACAGKTLPWLQATEMADVWALWGVKFRDVWVLDGENRLVAVYNVTQHNLAEAANYQELRDILVQAAGP